MSATVDINVVLTVLRGYGFTAQLAHGPSEFTVEARDGAGYLSFALDFNVSGWEVAYDEDDTDQRALHGWLSGQASSWQVACWAAALALDPKMALDADSYQVL